MDLDAILARHPEVALVDELAHTNVPGLAEREALAGRRGAARRRDRRHLHREHPAPRVAQRRRRGDHRHQAAGDDPRRGRPRRRADRAGRLHPRGAAAADGPRQHLRARQGRRRARQLLPARQPGRPPRARAALGRRPGRRVAPGVPRAARDRGAWETRERVAVAVTGAPGNDNLIRRASRIASRAKGDLVGVHVRADDGLADARQRHRCSSTASSLEELGGTYREVVGSDVAKALVQAARAEGGHPARPRRQPPIAMGRARRAARSSAGSSARPAGRSTST